MLFRLFAPILLLLLSGGLLGQSNSAREARRLLDMAYDYFYVNLDSCHRYNLLALDQGQAAGDDWLLAEVYKGLGGSFAEVGQVDSVLFYYRKAHAIYADSKRPEAYLNRLQVATAIAQAGGQYAKSLELSLRWATECQRTGDEQCLADAFWDAGSAFYFQNQQQEAVDYSRRALRIMARGGDQIGYANCLIGFSESQCLQGDYAGARVSLERARSIITDQNVPLLMAELHLYEGKVYAAQDSLDEAAQTLQKGIRFAEKSAAAKAKAMLIGTLGRVALRKQNYKEAVFLLKKEFIAAANFQETYYFPEYRLSLSKAFAAQGRYDSAYYYLSIAERNYRDNVRDDYDHQLSELQIRYETNEKENQIALQEVTLKRQRMQLYASGAVTFLLLLVTFIFVLFSRKLGRKNRQNLRLLREKETLIGEIHHRVKNNLQVVASLLQLQRRRLSTPDPQVQNMLRETQSRIEAMGLIHQKLYLADDLVTVDMSIYLEELGEVLLEAYRLDDSVELFFDVEPISLDVSMAIPLGLIVNELITNSLKHAFPLGAEGTIEITLFGEDQQLVLRVSDNGAGTPAIPSDKQIPSFGTELIDLLSKKLRGVTRQMEVKGYGTEITFSPKGYRPAPAAPYAVSD